jgi:hypothetical protein
LEGDGGGYKACVTMLRGAILAVAALAVAAVAVAVVLDPGSRSGVDRIKDLVAWPDSCAAVDIDSPVTSGDGASWSRATEAARVTCEHLGPTVLYARFERARDLRADLLQHPPSAATCIAREEVVVDGLDEGQFPELCRALAGDLVDGVTGLPRPSGRTIDAINASSARYHRRAIAAQRRALRGYWRGTGS